MRKIPVLLTTLFMLVITIVIRNQSPLLCGITAGATCAGGEADILCEGCCNAAVQVETTDHCTSHWSTIAPVGYYCTATNGYPIKSCSTKDQDGHIICQYTGDSGQCKLNLANIGEKCDDVPFKPMSGCCADKPASTKTSAPAPKQNQNVDGKGIHGQFTVGGCASRFDLFDAVECRGAATQDF